MSSLKIALVGSGNVATHLGRALKPHICGIYGRGEESTGALARELGCPHSTDFATLADSACDVVIVSLADRAAEDVAKAIGPLPYNPLVLHTSGTLPKELFNVMSPRTGVLYPLQTFSKAARVDISRVPFFTEACTEADLAVVDTIAHMMSPHVYHADAARRKSLHIAGVFTSNFTNVLLECVQQVLAADGYPLDTVRPLLEATVQKAFELGPHAAQTGPARRGDLSVIAKHIEALPEELRPVYTELSNLILKLHHEPN